MSRRTTKDYIDYKDYIDVTSREFNLMGIYLMRINNIADRRDVAFEEGEILSFYRSTRSLLSNVEPKLLSEKIDAAEIVRAVKELGQKIRSVVLIDANEKMKQKNLLLLEEDLLDLNTEINKKITAAGMIYPKKEFKTIEELRKEDY